MGEGVVCSQQKTSATSAKSLQSYVVYGASLGPTNIPNIPKCYSNPFFRGFVNFFSGRTL